MSRFASHRHIFIVTGPAGCGKSMLAAFLAEQYGFLYIEGDDFHPQSNVEKMATGVPLNDGDRWDWLILLRDQALAALDQGARGVVVTCSALKKKYRDVIRLAGVYGSPHRLRFIYLRASKDVLLSRVHGRQGHYMKDTMVVSQLSSLEEPDEKEKDMARDVLCIDVSGSKADVQRLATALVNRILGEDAATLEA